MCDSRTRASRSLAHTGGRRWREMRLDMLNTIGQTKHVAKDHLLGQQVGRVLLVRRRDQWDALADVQTEVGYAVVLALVVGHQPHAPHAKVAQYLRSNSIVATVDRKSKPQVGLHSVGTFVLQGICA